MSRYKELKDAIDNQNIKGGVSYEKWMTFLLTDIALSLAAIADALVIKAEVEE